MSTSFKVKTHSGVMDTEPTIALRFWGGSDDGQTVRFAFPREVMFHLQHVEVVGDNMEETTLGALFDKFNTCDFIAHDVPAGEHLSWGTDEARRRHRQRSLRLQHR